MLCPVMFLRRVSAVVILIIFLALVAIALAGPAAAQQGAACDQYSCPEGDQSVSDEPSNSPTPEITTPQEHDSEPSDLGPLDPETVESETVEPETVEPETVEPETVEPETVEPETVEPGPAAQDSIPGPVPTQTTTPRTTQEDSGGALPAAPEPGAEAESPTPTESEETSPVDLEGQEAQEPQDPSETTASPEPATPSQEDTEALTENLESDTPAHTQDGSAKQTESTGASGPQSNSLPREFQEIDLFVDLYPPQKSDRVFRVFTDRCADYSVLYPKQIDKYCNLDPNHPKLKPYKKNLDCKIYHHTKYGDVRGCSAWEKQPNGFWNPNDSETWLFDDEGNHIDTVDATPPYYAPFKEKLCGNGDCGIKEPKKEGWSCYNVRWDLGEIYTSRYESEIICQRPDIADYYFTDKVDQSKTCELIYDPRTGEKKSRKTCGPRGGHGDIFYVFGDDAEAAAEKPLKGTDENGTDENIGSVSNAYTVKPQPVPLYPFAPAVATLDPATSGPATSNPTSSGPGTPAQGRSAPAAPAPAAPAPAAPTPDSPTPDSPTPSGFIPAGSVPAGSVPAVPAPAVPAPAVPAIAMGAPALATQDLANPMVSTAQVDSITNTVFAYGPVILRPAPFASGPVQLAYGLAVSPAAGGSSNSPGGSPGGLNLLSGVFDPDALRGTIPVSISEPDSDPADQVAAVSPSEDRAQQAQKARNLDSGYAFSPAANSNSASQISSAGAGSENSSQSEPGSSYLVLLTGASILIGGALILIVRKAA